MSDPVAPQDARQRAAQDAPHLDTADELGFQLVRFIRLVGRASAQFTTAQKGGIERASYALLAHLVLDGPQRTTALAEAVHSDTSTVSRQSGALVQHGLVERRADPDDGRACLLAATERGTRVFEHNRRERNRHIARLTDHWPDEDRRTLVTLLDRFNSDCETYRPDLVDTPRAVHEQGETP
ncbi:winged helix-turn-helix transcriptional regulator [Solihabitans fulvus]|uniref:Winged helix-turn-helix transcriptional regulator n=2 Tax=Solihabitans fulvus TaxID=1892852 RepID=A0A5B2WKE4_9PSEU|nr:winged helix-turn-helix transcriptional regulator [Solihabitans fulvus]